VTQRIAAACAERFVRRLAQRITAHSADIAARSYYGTRATRLVSSDRRAAGAPDVPDDDLAQSVIIVAALGLVALLSQVFELSIFTVNMLTGMGLALGIDYRCLSSRATARSGATAGSQGASGAPSSTAFFAARRWVLPSQSRFSSFSPRRCSG
jgi:hypothetical protein